MERKLYRSNTNRVFLGVCGGLGEYFNIDPVIVRVIAVLLGVFTWIIPAIIAYFIMGLVIPLRGSTASTPEDSFRKNVEDIRDSATRMGENIRNTFESKSTPPNSASLQTSPQPQPATHHSANSGLYLAGIIIIAIGLFLLLINFTGWLFAKLWPLWLIAAGIIIIAVVAGRRRRTG